MSDDPMNDLLERATAATELATAQCAEGWRLHAAERRERLATAALQGILTNPAAGGCGPVEEIAHYAVRYADALIAELDKEPQP